MLDRYYFHRGGLIKFTVGCIAILVAITLHLSTHGHVLYAQDDDIDEIGNDDIGEVGGNAAAEADIDSDFEEEYRDGSDLDPNNATEPNTGDNTNQESTFSDQVGQVEPYDEITYRNNEGAQKRTAKIFPVDQPISNIDSQGPPLKFFRYRENGSPDKSPFKVRRSLFDKIKYFENRAYVKAAELICTGGNSPDTIGPNTLQIPQSDVEQDKWEKAEKLLKSGIEEHDSLVDQVRRDALAFAPLRMKLLNALAEMEFIEINACIESGDFDQADDLCDQLENLARDFSHKKRIHKIYEIISAERIKNLLATSNYQEVQGEIDELKEKIYPSAPSADYEKIIKDIRILARDYFDRGKQASNPRDRKQFFASANQLDPRPEYRQASDTASENHEVLTCVFIDDIPRNFSPLSTESTLDRHAVSMLFEGLVRWSAQSYGKCFVAEMIDGRPQALAKGRRFRLKKNYKWSDSATISPNDVRRSLDLAKEFHPAGYPPFWEDIIGDVDTPGNEPFIFEIQLNEDHWAPLALMTFPILPMHHFPTMGAKPDEIEAFNKKPVGTGAYVLDDESCSEEFVRFRVNPHYPNPPAIEEVVFKSFEQREAEIQFDQKKVDLIYDAGKTMVEKYPNNYTTFTSDSVYMLVPNYSKSTTNSLKNLTLRRAISNSIKRQEILKRDFPGDDDEHASLQGIFPKSSWASHQDLQDNTSSGRAGTLFKEAKKQLKAQYPQKLILAHPKNSDIQKACNAIKEGIEKASGFVNAKIEIELKQIEKKDYDDRVKKGLAGEEYSFDLAYWKHEYQDGIYSCDSLFDPDSGSNLQQYDEYRDLQGLFSNLRTHKQFTEIRDISREIDKHIATYVPVIPLWQLDTFIVFSNRLDFGENDLDSIRPFQGVKTWEIR